MQAYEYREGSVPSLDGVNLAFFKHLADHVRDNDLESLLGLQVLAKDVPKMTCVFVLEGNGTVMLDARVVKNWNPYTLTTALGPLMRKEHPQCRRTELSAQKLSKYIHGASAIFTWRIAEGQTVILLSPPPPERFHPSGLSYFQVIEEPIFKTRSGQDAPWRIMVVHPTVEGAADFSYEIWPLPN